MLPEKVYLKESVCGSQFVMSVFCVLWEAIGWEAICRICILWTAGVNLLSAGINWPGGNVRESICHPFKL